MKYQIVIVWFPFYLEYLWFFSMQLKAKHSNSDNHQTMIHMTNHRPLHNDIYHYMYVSHHTMIAIHISVTVNMVSWGICMHVEMDIIYWYWKYMKYWYNIKYYLYSSQ